MRKTLLALSAFVLALALVSAAPAAGQHPFENESTPATDSWMDGNEDPTLDNLSHMFTRSISWFVGGSGTATSTATGLLVGLFVLNTMGYNRAGLAAGGISGAAGFFAMYSAGLAPRWAYVVMLGLLGLVVSAAYFRLTR